MRSITLITGGSRSGKSVYAIARATEGRDARCAFLATAEALDDEMRSRIARHRANRPDAFETIEEPLNIVASLARLSGRADVIVIDCLTLWVSNLMATGARDEAILLEADALAATLRETPASSFVVTDEVGSGIVPDNPAARRFRDLLGWTNQKIGRVADEIILMVAGHPMRVK
jgi:adenosylcobinamide kinase / adenosylcobinamide-phosphate guanylyltransferase